MPETFKRIGAEAASLTLLPLRPFAPSPLLAPGPRERESTGAVEMTSEKLNLFSLQGAGIVLTFVVLDVGKQLLSYGINYHNDGRPPVDVALYVLSCELFKMLVTLFRAKDEVVVAVCSIRSRAHLRSAFISSWMYLVPSICYCMNNMLYLFALTLTSPPLWLLLISFRTVITAFTYKVILRKEVTDRQLFGCLLIVLAVIISQLNKFMEHGSSVNHIPRLAFLLAFVSSCLSVSAAVSTEMIFKVSSPKSHSFLVKQLWIYFYSAIVAVISALVRSSTGNLVGEMIGDLSGLSRVVLFLLVLSIVVNGLGGIVVASVLKYLDNVTKEYSASSANFLTAVICALLFPDAFSLTLEIVLAMGVLSCGIYMYETKNGSFPNIW